MTQIAAVEADELLVWHLLFTSGLHGERLIVVACALVEFESDSQENIYTYEYCIHIHIVFVAEIISPHNVFKEEAIRSLCCKFQFKSNVFALTSLLYELMTTRNEMTKIIIRTIDQIPFFLKGKFTIKLLFPPAPVSQGPFELSRHTSGELNIMRTIKCYLIRMHGCLPSKKHKS